MEPANACPDTAGIRVKPRPTGALRRVSQETVRMVELALLLMTKLNASVLPDTPGGIVRIRTKYAIRRIAEGTV